MVYRPCRNLHFQTKQIFVCRRVFVPDTCSPYQRLSFFFSPSCVSLRADVYIHAYVFVLLSITTSVDSPMTHHAPLTTSKLVRVKFRKDLTSGSFTEKAECSDVSRTAVRTSRYYLQATITYTVSQHCREHLTVPHNIQWYININIRLR